MQSEVDKELTGPFPDKVLLEDGLYALEKALESLMDMTSPSGIALAHFVHAAFVFGEKLMGIEE